MTLILFLLHLFTGLPNLGADTQPSGIQLNGNVKSVTGDRPPVMGRG